MSTPVPRREKPAPSLNGIDVWTWRLGASDAELSVLIRLLSEDELARAARQASAQLRGQFIVGRARLRQILARYLAMPPEALRFSYGRHGKPLLSQHRPALSFNLSHSGDLAALAVSRCGAIGIDVEQLRPVGTDISLRFFTESEKAILARLSGQRWLEAFYRCWTRKEALLKAIGTGLTGGLAVFDVALAREATAGRLHIRGGEPCYSRGWTLYDLPLDAGFVGALAITPKAGVQPFVLMQRDEARWSAQINDVLSPT
jgi:4'-phosphopantetheinyl transferase